MRLTDAVKSFVGKGYSLRWWNRIFFALTSFSNTPEDRLLRMLNMKGTTVYDIGAHIGTKTMLFAKKAERVIAFEPNPESFSQLLSNMSEHHLKNVIAFNVGLGSRNEETTLVARAFSTATGSVSPLVCKTWKKGTYREWKVKLRTLDSFALPSPDLVKIDVEGHEYEVLEGMHETLKCGSTILIELHGIDPREARANIDKIMRLLNRANYKIYHVETWRSLSSERPTSGHILAVRARLTGMSVVTTSYDEHARNNEAQRSFTAVCCSTAESYERSNLSYK